MPAEAYPTIAAKVRELREGYRLGSREVERRAGLPNGTMSGIETARLFLASFRSRLAPILGDEIHKLVFMELELRAQLEEIGRRAEVAAGKLVAAKWPIHVQFSQASGALTDDEMRIELERRRREINFSMILSAEALAAEMKLTWPPIPEVEAVLKKISARWVDMLTPDRPEPESEKGG